MLVLDGRVGVQDTALVVGRYVLAVEGDAFEPEAEGVEVDTGDHFEGEQRVEGGVGEQAR